MQTISARSSPSHIPELSEFWSVPQRSKNTQKICNAAEIAGSSPSLCNNMNLILVSYFSHFYLKIKCSFLRHHFPCTSTIIHETNNIPGEILSPSHRSSSLNCTWIMLPLLSHNVHTMLQLGSGDLPAKVRAYFPSPVLITVRSSLNSNRQLILH